MRANTFAFIASVALLLIFIKYSSSQLSENFYLKGLWRKLWRNSEREARIGEESFHAPGFVYLSGMQDIDHSVYPHNTEAWFHATGVYYTYEDFNGRIHRHEIAFSEISNVSWERNGEKSRVNLELTGPPCRVIKFEVCSHQELIERALATIGAHHAATPHATT